MPKKMKRASKGETEARKKLKKEDKAMEERLKILELKIERLELEAERQAEERTRARIMQLADRCFNHHLRIACSKD